MKMNAESLYIKLLRDSSNFKNNLSQEDRPLKNVPTKDLVSDGYFEKIRVDFEFKTLGEARDLVGFELGMRTFYTDYGY